MKKKKQQLIVDHYLRLISSIRKDRRRKKTFTGEPLH
jgi:hypothetical protein